MRPYALRIGAALLLVLAAKLANVGVPLIMKQIVDNMDPTKALITVPLALLAAYGILRVLSTLFDELRKLVYVKITVNVIQKVLLRVFTHLFDLSLRFHLGRQTGRLTREVERGQHSIVILADYAFFTIFPTLVECALVFGILIYKYDWTFVVIAFSTLGVYIIYTIRVSEWRVGFRKKFNEYDSQVSYQITDSLLNYETVKYFDNEKWEQNRFNNTMTRRTGAWITTERSMLVLQTGQSSIVALSMTLMLWRATVGITHGVMTVGDLVLVSTLMMQLYAPLNFLGMIYREVRQAIVDMERLIELDNEAVEIKDQPCAQPLQLDGSEVCFDNVSFHYEDNRKILNNISFTVPTGHTLALVGPSGAGKSTISRLLFRFYDPTSGRVTINGQDIRTVTQSSLRSAIGIVPQDTVLFNETIGYNLAYGKPGATQEEIENAAHMAQLDKFINCLPDGYDTIVGERGLKLSGGEKQRVSIARTLLKQPAIFIFDEATSSLDSRSEKQIQQEIDSIAKENTTLIIAHRLSTVVNADMILVVDQGSVTERGTHAELIAQNGLYAKMWRLQQDEKNMERAEETPPE